MSHIPLLKLLLVYCQLKNAFEHSANQVTFLNCKALSLLLIILYDNKISHIFLSLKKSRRWRGFNANQLDTKYCKSDLQKAVNVPWIKKSRSQMFIKYSSEYLIFKNGADTVITTCVLHINNSIYSLNIGFCLLFVTFELAWRKELYI